MAKTTLSIPALAAKVPTEAAAYEFLEQLRWGDAVVCPHCTSDRAYFLTPKDGTDARKTRTGTTSERRVWKCAACRKQFSALTGTIFHGSKIPVRTWLFVVFEMCASKNGVSAREVERKYGLTAKSAWFMTQRIREAMKRDPLAGLMSGVVIADETWIGGDPKNKHKNERWAGPGKGFTDKQPVMSLIDRSTGEVRSAVVPNVRGDSLRRVLAEHTDPATTDLHTDTSAAYKALGKTFRTHEKVNHEEWEYVRGEVTTNHVEGFFSQLKRSIDGTHHHVSVEHLHRYLAEFDFRYSTRHLNDTQRVSRLMGRVAGRRLSYRPLIGG